MAAPTATELTERDLDYELGLVELRFVHHYIANGGNATKAYQEASGGTRDSNAASEMRHRPKVVAAIERRLRVAGERADIQAAELLREVQCLAYSNMQDYIDEDENGRGIAKSPSMVTRAQMAAVKEWVVDERTFGPADNRITTRRTRIKLHEKLPAIALLGRAQGTFKERDGSDDTREALFSGAVSAAGRIIEELATRRKGTDLTLVRQERPLLPPAVYTPKG